MTDLILKYFVPGFRDTDDPRIRTRIGSLSGITGIVCNLLLFAGKLLCGILSGSVSMTADAMNNLSDASGAMVTLLGFKLAGRPADEDHPYGHARYEYLTGLAVAGWFCSSVLSWQKVLSCGSFPRNLWCFLLW